MLAVIPSSQVARVHAEMHSARLAGQTVNRRFHGTALVSVLALAPHSTELRTAASARTKYEHEHEIVSPTPSVILRMLHLATNERVEK